MKNETCPALSSWRVLIDFASYLVAEVQQPTCHLWTNIKWVFTFKIRYVLLSYKSKVIQLNCKQWNEMAYLILNSLLNLNLFLDFFSCHRSMGCPLNHWTKREVTLKYLAPQFFKLLRSLVSPNCVWSPQDVFDPLIRG